MAHILVVDDDEIILKVVKATLQKAGHAVTLAKDGYDALDLLKNELFDLIVTDANMPRGISGFNLVTTVRADERTKNIPVIFLTSRREEGDVIRALKSGADDYTVKPLSAEVFLEKIEALLSARLAPGEAGMTLLLTPAPGTWAMDFEILGISEKGLELRSPVEIPPHTQLQIQSPFLAKLGLGATQLRVLSSTRSGEAPHPYTVRASFVSLSKPELEAILRWINGQGGHKTKQAS